MNLINTTSGIHFLSLRKKWLIGKQKDQGQVFVDNRHNRNEHLKIENFGLRTWKISQQDI